MSLKTVQSACVVQVPSGGAIDEIRKVHDRSFGRWPPHINLLYPFVDASTFPAAVELIRPILSRIPPFTLTLTEFGEFDHRSSLTIWIRPETEVGRVNCSHVIVILAKFKLLLCHYHDSLQTF
jgi:poly(A) polymerase